MNADASRISADKPCLPPFANEQRAQLLQELLPRVSRSFSLTLRVLPDAIRPQIGLAYLLARAADTIADTRVIPREKRLMVLLLFRRQLEQRLSADELAEIQRDLVPHQSLPAEKQLIERLGQCFELLATFSETDRRLIRDVVVTLTRGMEFDLRRFAGESADAIGSLTTPDELDQYTYFVAGCVGPFWTRICMVHLPQLNFWDVDQMCDLGVRFGKGLQHCNVLRDIPRDLRMGRCYLPSIELEKQGLTPRDLLDPTMQEKLGPLYAEYLDVALAHLRAGWQYTMSVPASLARLRLACAWPILIGLKTLGKLRGSRDILNPHRRIKISRGEVYGIMARSFLKKRSDAALNRYYESLVQDAK